MKWLLAVLIFFTLAGCAGDETPDAGDDAGLTGDPAATSAGNSTGNMTNGNATTGNATAGNGTAGATNSTAGNATQNETVDAPAPAQEDGTFDGSMTAAAASKTHTWSILEGHAGLVVKIDGDHTIDGSITASLVDPSGAVAATGSGLDITLEVAEPMAGEWTLNLKLELVDASYTGTWCAGQTC